ncbi:hypothetical protein [Streptomyces tropicalis]|uniref:Uncharacterized protein n=1 Tax=Streptomyces tropicalis TaxID=3034234 RepID=A0ABT6ADD3_9ACTN|nr:hypothetical protein [Streptomyces tropicalis]MDF3302668.1 hypothetical protein [Streptomyces tropicalis]
MCCEGAGLGRRPLLRRHGPQGATAAAAPGSTPAPSTEPPHAVDAAARKAGQSAGHHYPLVEASVATSAEAGFDSARTKVHDYFDGEGIPRKLDTED